jgi:outer membrane protein assembly factor BamB
MFMNTENKIGINQNVANTSGNLRTPGVINNDKEMSVEDSFSHVAGEVPELSKSQINSILFSVEGIQKSKYDFRLRGFAQGPDGTLYTAYSDPNQEKGNYISAQSADGEVKWETNVGENGLLDISTGPDGMLYARTKDKLVAFEPDGERKFEHDFEGRVSEERVHSNGNTYFRENYNNNLYIIDNTGKRMETPPEMSQLRPGDIRIMDNNMWFQERTVLKRFDQTNGVKTAEYRFEEFKEKMVNKINDFKPLPNDELLVFGNDEETVMDNHYPHHFHKFGKFGMGAGWGMPHLPMDYYPSSYTINHNYLAKVDKDSNEQWKVKIPGHNPQLVMRDDGMVMFSSEYKNKDDDKFHISTIDVNGDQNSFASVDTRITEFKLRPADNHLFVRVENGTIFEFDEKGKELRAAEPQDDNKLKIAGFSADGNVLMTDGEKKEIHCWNPDDNKLTRLTDHTKDHTLKIALKQKLQEQEKQEKDDKTVVIQDEYVTVGGVKVKKWNKGKKT